MAGGGTPVDGAKSATMTTNCQTKRDIPSTSMIALMTIIEGVKAAITAAAVVDATTIVVAVAVAAAALTTVLKWIACEREWGPMCGRRRLAGSLLPSALVANRSYGNVCDVSLRFIFNRRGNEYFYGQS